MDRCKGISFPHIELVEKFSYCAARVREAKSRSTTEEPSESPFNWGELRRDPLRRKSGMMRSMGLSSGIKGGVFATGRDPKLAKHTHGAEARNVSQSHIRGCFLSVGIVAAGKLRQSGQPDQNHQLIAESLANSRRSFRAELGWQALHPPKACYVADESGLVGDAVLTFRAASCLASCSQPMPRSFSVNRTGEPSLFCRF